MFLGPDRMVGLLGRGPSAYGGVLRDVLCSQLACSLFGSVRVGVSYRLLMLRPRTLIWSL